MTKILIVVALLALLVVLAGALTPSVKAEPACPTSTRTATLTPTSTPLSFVPGWLYFPIFRLDATDTPTLTPTITPTSTSPPRTRVCPGGGGCCKD